MTGPVLLYDEALFQFSDGVLPYLSWRVWIGLWTTVIALAVAAFQASKERIESRVSRIDLTREGMHENRVLNESSYVLRKP